MSRWSSSLRVPALSSLSNIPSPTTRSEGEEGAATLARANRMWCLHAWLLLCLGHEAAVSRAAGTCVVTRAGSHRALVSLQGPRLAR